ncbi:MAG: NIPSNAP family protein [Oscillospiraceae bacterium]
MITCYLKYVIDPYKLKEFEEYGKTWITLVNRMGGTHHGYFMPYEGDNNIAYALFSFPSLARYEEYRKEINTDKDCQLALAYAEKTRCMIRWYRQEFCAN